MKALQSIRHKKGIYTIITTFILVITILVCIGLLFFVNNTLLVFKEQKSIGVREKYEFKNIRDRLYYCYGNIVDENDLLADLDCMNLKEKQGFSIRKIEYIDCPGGVIKELNFRGTGRIERHYIPIYHANRSIVCPAELTVYENAGRVPIILNASIDPLVGSQGTNFDVLINFYHTVYPSYFNLSVRNGQEIMRIDSGAMGQGSDSVTMTIPSSSLVPGLYTATVYATHDGEFVEISEEIAKFRIIDPNDIPILNNVITPSMPESIWDQHSFIVNLSDYVDVETVEIVFTSNGAEVDRIELTRIGNSTHDDLSNDYIYRGTWDSSSMPNQDAAYGITIVATNELGNTMTEITSETIVIESGATGLVLIVTNDRVASTLGSALDDYQSALAFDGYASEFIRLDTTDVSACDSALSPAAGPTISANDAMTIIPRCISHFESVYGNNLEDSTHILIIGGHQQITSYDDVGSEGSYYTDDHFADLNGDTRPDRPIGRLPDGVPPGDESYLTALATAAQAHRDRGWPSLGTDYVWTLDVPRGEGSPSNIHIACINYAMDTDNANMCSENPNCFFAPPYNQAGDGLGIPPRWTTATNLIYVSGHGNPDGMQTILDHEPRFAFMGDARTMGQRDYTNSLLFFNTCWGGRINNVNPEQSVVMQALNSGAVAVFGGTSPQSYVPYNEECTSMPLTIGQTTGSTYMANLAYEVNKRNPKTIGDAWLVVHNSVTDTEQREHNLLFGDPSVRVK